MYKTEREIEYLPIEESLIDYEDEQWPSAVIEYRKGFTSDKPPLQYTTSALGF